MQSIFIIISKYLFVLYMAIFLLNGFLINLTRQEMADFNIAYRLSNQRLSIYFTHITAAIIFVTVNLDGQWQKVLAYFTASLFLIMIGDIILRTVYKEASHMLYNCIFYAVDIGLIILYRLDGELAIKQLIWCAVGVFLLVVLPFVLNVLPRLDRLKILYVFLSLALLIATLIFGKSEYGSKNWLNVGPVGFQPSEIVKILYVLYISSVLSHNPSLKKIFRTAIISGIVIICLVLQKDLGSALIFFMTFLVVVYIATGKFLYLFAGMLALPAASLLGYTFFDHIKVRVSSWLDPWSDIAGGGYQVTQSLFAITTYGLMGIGLTKGFPENIPVVERDFIFAAICEEMGVLFGIGVIMLFVLMFLEGVRASLESRSRFLTLLCAGLTVLLSFQTFLIIGGVIKFIPLTGVTLPFISYGGTSIVITFAIMSVVQWIFTRNNSYTEDKSEDETDNRVRLNQSKVTHKEEIFEDTESDSEEEMLLNEAIPPKKRKNKHEKID